VLKDKKKSVKQKLLRKTNVLVAMTISGSDQMLVQTEITKVIVKLIILLQINVLLVKQPNLQRQIRIVKDFLMQQIVKLEMPC